MIDFTKELPTLKEIESHLFQELQEVYQDALLHILEELDDWLKDNRDTERLENHEKQATTLATMFGPVTIHRRKYKDREKHQRVALLDQYLEYNGESTLSPFLTEMVVEWAVRGPSYRDAQDRFLDLLGYQAASHESIRQEVLAIPSKEIETQADEPKKEKDVLFLEVDGLHVHKQCENHKSSEVKIGIVHEGWAPYHPSSQKYQLRNKSYWASLDKGEDFWEAFSRHLHSVYDTTPETHIVINGDAASWIRGGTDYFTNAVYTYDRYHLKQWSHRALSNRKKKERRRAYIAADENDPVALAAAIAEAEKEEDDEGKQEEIQSLRLFVVNHQEALRDYRTLLQEKDSSLDTSSMRPMGAAESNMNLFASRFKKMGYSWSTQRLRGMLLAFIHRLEGSLLQAVRKRKHPEKQEPKEPKGYPSFTTLLTEKTRQSVGAIHGHMPALDSSDRNKPYAKALRGLAGF